MDSIADKSWINIKALGPVIELFFKNMAYNYPVSKMSKTEGQYQDDQNSTEISDTASPALHLKISSPYEALGNLTDDYSAKIFSITDITFLSTMPIGKSLGSSTLRLIALGIRPNILPKIVQTFFKALDSYSSMPLSLVSFDCFPSLTSLKFEDIRHHSYPGSGGGNHTNGAPSDNSEIDYSLQIVFNCPKSTNEHLQSTLIQLIKASVASNNLNPTDESLSYPPLGTHFQNPFYVTIQHDALFQYHRRIIIFHDAFQVNPKASEINLLESNNVSGWKLVKMLEKPMEILTYLKNANYCFNQQLVELSQKLTCVGYLQRLIVEEIYGSSLEPLYRQEVDFILPSFLDNESNLIREESSFESYLKYPFHLLQFLSTLSPRQRDMCIIVQLKKDLTLPNSPNIISLPLVMLASHSIFSNMQSHSFQRHSFTRCYSQTSRLQSDMVCSNYGRPYTSKSLIPDVFTLGGHVGHELFEMNLLPHLCSTTKEWCCFMSPENFSRSIGNLIDTYLMTCSTITFRFQATHFFKATCLIVTSTSKSFKNCEINDLNWNENSWGEKLKPLKRSDLGQDHDTMDAMMLDRFVLTIITTKISFSLLLHTFNALYLHGVKNIESIKTLASNSTCQHSCPLEEELEALSIEFYTSQSKISSILITLRDDENLSYQIGRQHDLINSDKNHWKGQMKKDDMRTSFNIRKIVLGWYFPLLFLFDMDSTLIYQECLDEMANYIGVSSLVSDITTRAMSGELDFPSALAQRLELLKGAESAPVFDHVFAQLELMRGARPFINVLRRLGSITAVVSGGFSQISSAVQSQLGLDYAFSNSLEIVKNLNDRDVFSGKLRSGSDLIDATFKKIKLEKLALEHDIPIEMTVAVGDGANDIKMLKSAGLGIAFNAKAIVRKEISCHVNFPNFVCLFYLLGIGKQQWEELLKDEI